MKPSDFAWHCRTHLLVLCLGLSGAGPLGLPVNASAAGVGLRCATFNLSLNRNVAGELVSDLSLPVEPTGVQANRINQIRTVAEIIQQARPDILLLNEFDYVPNHEAIDLFQKHFLEVGQDTLKLGNASPPASYPYRFVEPSNTGVPSGYDLDNNGTVGGGNDAFGFGNFPGQFGMALLSKYPIVTDRVRTFQTFLWKDMPGALLPDDPNTPEPSDYYSAQELAVFRLSSKSHWDVPVNVNGTVVHLLVSHPTPPVFDGPEDRNGRRNHDEIRFWADYVSPERSGYIYDDAGRKGGLAAGERFVIMGDQNADPLDGDSVSSAIDQLLAHPLVNASVVPQSAGAVEQSAIQGGANSSHRAPAAHDTADFADTTPGNLRADYVLPSRNGITALSGGVFWPLMAEEKFPLVGVFNNPNLFAGFPSSDHRLVWMDLRIEETLEENSEVFAHGVASGDPSSDGVVLWTRVSDPAVANPELPLSVTVALDERFSNIVMQRSDLQARAAHDFCVKVKLAGLQPWTHYYYRFTYQGTNHSMVGRTKTAPLAGAEVPVRFAFLSCQDYIGRHFNTLAHLVQNESDNLDFVVHLGDYVYETTGDPGFQSTGAVRRIVLSDTNGAIRLGGFHAAATLGNYREIYRTYRSDPHLKRLHARFPMVAIWDDHEYSDDNHGATATYFDGRRNELSVERRRNAEQVYFEYMPNSIGMDEQGVKIDTSILFPGTKLYQDFRFGAYLHLWLTDFRSYRPDHLVAEDAFPGAVVVDETAAAGLLGPAWVAVRNSFDPYLNVDEPGYAGLKSAMVQIVTGAYLAEGLAAAEAQGKALEVVTGNLSSTYVNALFVAAGQSAPLGGNIVAGLPRGLSYLFMGKQALFASTGSRQLLVRDAFQVFAAYKALQDPSSQDALGAAQRTWLATTMAGSAARWKVVGSSVSFCPITFDFANPPFALPDGFPSQLRTRLQLSADHWDGFPQARQAMIDLLAEHDATIISGDIHGSFMSNHKSSGGKLVPEFTGPSASSESFKEQVGNVVASDPVLSSIPGINQLVAATDLLIQDALAREEQSTLVDLKTDSHGYVVMEARAEGLQASYRHIAGSKVEQDQTGDPVALDTLFREQSYGVIRSEVGLEMGRVNLAPVAKSLSLDVTWKDAIPVTLSGSDPEGQPLSFKMVSQPTSGTLTGVAPSLVYLPFLGANGTDSFTYQVNDGEMDSEVVTVRITIRGVTNLGLVGVGRIPADAFDSLGVGIDTLGGIGSGTYFDASTWKRTGGKARGYTYSGTLYALPDRGFGDGAQNYLPRIQTLSFSLSPYYGAGPVVQNQIVLSNTSSLLLTYQGTNFTGYDGDDRSSTDFPRSSPGSLGQGRRSLDPEGIVRLSDGSFFISDEYGPFIYKFDASGSLEYTMTPPESIMPKLGAYPGANYFTATNGPLSGRRNNRGMEGISITPDGQRLFAVLQSPTIGDGGGGNPTRNTRVLVYDIDPGSATFKLPIAQYVYQLTLNGNAATNRHTPISEILALNREQFLVLERDGNGLGSATNINATYKRVVLASTAGASNILNSPYDLERGAPGQLSLGANNLPSNVRPVSRFDLVDMLDEVQLAKFGLNNSTNQDANTLSEKWESLSLVPVGDPAAPHDHFLLVMNDNDFKAPVVYHNSMAVGTNDITMDNMMLAYRVRLPTLNAPVPSNRIPGVYLAGPTNSFLSTPVAFTVSAQSYDQDGRITRVEFWQGDTKVSEDTTYPFEFAVNNPAVGEFSLRAIAFDNDGASATSGVYRVMIISEQTDPIIALSNPVDGAVIRAPATLRMTTLTGDADGWVRQVAFFVGSTQVGTVSNAPFSLTLSNYPLGNFVLSATATDNHGRTVTSQPVSISVMRALSGSPLQVQILHGSDFEAGVEALADAPRFSSVLNSLKAAHSNTVVLAAGDNYIPGPFFFASADPAAYNGKGRGDILLLNALGIQASVVGNHEFDDTPATFRDLLRVSGTYPGTRFPYLSANLDFSTDSATSGLVTGDGQDYRRMTNRVARSCVIPVGGELLGVVGATTRDFRAITSAGGVGVNPDILKAVQSAVDGLLAQGVNKIVLVTQLQQIANEIELAQQLRDVDVIIAGGSNTILAKDSDRLRVGDVREGDYPLRFVSASGETVHVVSTDGNYRYVGRLVVTFDTQGVISEAHALSGAYATDPQGVEETGNVAPNAEVVSVTDTLRSIILAKDATAYGRTTVYLNGLRGTVRSEESNLGNLSADANLWFGRQVDPQVGISLKNGGGIRDSIGAVDTFGNRVPPPANPVAGKPEGGISQLDIENALRFNNGLAILTLTAQQLRDAMEWSVAATTPTSTPGQFPQVSGLAFSYIMTNPPMSYVLSNTTPISIATPGSRLQTLIATAPDGSLDLVVENGQILGDPHREFRIVTLDFLAAGGDNYFPLTLGTGRTNLVDSSVVKTFTTPGSEQWALASYLSQIKVYSGADTPPANDRRIQNLAFREDTVRSPLLTRLDTEGGVVVHFTTLPGRRYHVWAAETLNGPWVQLTDAAGVLGTGYVTSYRDLNASGENKFYQIRYQE